MVLRIDQIISLAKPLPFSNLIMLGFFAAKLFVAMLFVAMLLAPLSYAGKAGHAEEKVRKLKSTISVLEKQLGEFKGESRSIEKSLRDAEVKSNHLYQQIASTRVSIATGTQRLASLNQQRGDLETERQVQQVALAKQVAAAYRIGRQDQIKLLLNQQQPERVSRILNYYEYLNQSRIEAVESFNQTLLSLGLVEKEINALQQQLVKRQSSLHKDSQQLQIEQKQRKLALKALGKKIKGDNKRLKRLKADRTRLQKVLKQLQQTLEKVDLTWESREFKQLKGELKWPTKGRVVQTFGRLTMQGLKSEGMLIRAPAGRQVTSVSHGRVVFSDWFRGFGLLMIVDHGSGYMSLYGHNQTLLKEVGDWVSANEKIATVGDTGGLSSTALYFAIRYKGQPYNPQSWLSRNRG